MDVATKKTPSKAAAGDAKKAAKPRKKKNEGDPGSRGLSAPELAAGAPPAALEALAKQIADDGGTVLGRYREPMGGNWQLLAGLPIEKVEPTPFQRDLSETHVARLTDVINRLDRFLDPLIAVRGPKGYWTPNGHHRLAALRRLGARSAVALVIPEEKTAYQILALNTEKAHNLKERALEVIKMAELLAGTDPRPEREFAAEFEEAAFLTLGRCYALRPRFSGGAYQSLLKRVDGFLDDKLPAALAIRGKRAEALLAIDDRVAELVKALKERGIESPALRGFVVASINPLKAEGAPRGKAKTPAEGPGFDATLKQMLAAAKAFDVAKVGVADLARLGGGPPAEE
jgi:ParB family chromosome partitioning protein